MNPMKICLVSRVKNVPAKHDTPVLNRPAIRRNAT